MRVKIAGAFVLVSALIALWLPTHGGGPGLGNLWVDATGGTCTRSADLVGYNDDAACNSLAAAYQAASPGDTVRVRAGSYGPQTIPTSSRSAPPVIIAESDDGDVTLASLGVNGDQVTVRDMAVSGGAAVIGPVGTGKAIGVRFERMSLRGGLYLQNTDQVAVVGTCNGLGPYRGCTSEVCCTHATEGQDAKTINMAGTDGSGPESANSNLSIIGTAVHTQTRENGSVHTECLFAIAIQGLTIRDSVFDDCAVYNMSIARIGEDPDPSDILVENTVFRATDDLEPDDRSGFFSIVLAHVTDNYAGMVFRNNTFETPVQFAGPEEDTPADAYDETLFVSNIMRFTESGTCAGQGTTVLPAYRFNVMDRGAGGCGPTDTPVEDVSDLWQDPGAGDFRLVDGAAAIGAGDPADSTAADIRGRPRDADPDAGAYEHG